VTSWPQILDCILPCHCGNGPWCKLLAHGATIPCASFPVYTAWMRILSTFFISDVSWVLANITSESSHCFWKSNRNSGRRLCIMVCPSFWEDYYMLIYTHCWELMNSVGSHGSLSLPFVMKVMVCHFVSDSHEVMTALIVVLPIIVVVEISLQLHHALFLYIICSSVW